MIVVLVGNFFFLNLFQGVLFGVFCESYKKEKEQGISDTKESMVWWDFLSQFEGIKPDYVLHTLPTNPIQRNIYLCVTHKYFDFFIFVIIFLNLIILGINFQDSPKSYNQTLYILNIIFTFIFFFEFILKMISLGVRGYINSMWNLLDLFIIITSAINIALEYTSPNNSVYFKAFQSLRVLRVLSLTKMIKSFRRLKSLDQLLQTIKWSLKSLINMAMILILIYSIFAIFGCYLFSNAKFSGQPEFNTVNEFFNFDNFYNSFWTVFRSVTGENWPTIMNEYYAGI